MERLREREELRCAYCHGALADQQVACRACDTRLHPDCRADLDRCPTLGCAGEAPRRRPTAAQRASRRAAALFWLPLASLVTLAVALPAAFGAPRPVLHPVQGGWAHESADMPAQLAAARELMANPDLHGTMSGRPRSTRWATHGERPELPDRRLLIEQVTSTHVVASWLEYSGAPETCGVVFLAAGEDASALREEMPDAQTLEIWAGIWAFRAPRAGR